jgi:4-hydroxyproline epimerase
MSQPPIHVIDSHTQGEPTRVVVSGGPDLGSGPLAGRARRLQLEHHWLRGAVCNEPRGHDAMVGALLCEADEPDCVCGVIFFNNVCNLGMCIHGTIGLTVTLAHLGKIGVGTHRIDTPVGVVVSTLREDGSVEVTNVPSYRTAADVAVDVPGWGTVRGDIAWGGNWFFIVRHDGAKGRAMRTHTEELAYAASILRALERAGIKGGTANGGVIDHVELLFNPSRPEANARNFVLCPNGTFDRSPCGTGTSALLASLAARGELSPGAVWRQESAISSMFEARYAVVEADVEAILPTIAGRAFLVAEGSFVHDAADPSRGGGWKEVR